MSNLNPVWIPPDSDFAKTWDEALERAVHGVTEDLTAEEVADVRLWLKGRLTEGNAFYKRISRGTHDAIMTLCSMGFG